jgi:Protein of unknown function (DUF4232)
MHLRINSTKRLIGGAALACAAALIPAAALASTAGTTAPASTPGCATSGLVVWMNTQGDGYAGGVSYTLNFTNLSGHACTLRGYPGVSAVTLSGRQIGRPAGWGNTKPGSVTLANGATATASLQAGDPANYGTKCFLPGPAPSPGHPGKLPTAAGLRVYPPNQRASKVIPFPISACASSGPVWLHAGPVHK